MTTSTPGGVDPDQVLVVADALRRIGHRAIKLGVRFSTFKQESWEAALEHVQDLSAGRQPRIGSDGAFLSPPGLLSAPCVAVGAPERPVKRWPPTERRGSAACWTRPARR